MQSRGVITELVAVGLFGSSSDRLMVDRSPEPFIIDNITRRHINREKLHEIPHVYPMNECDLTSNE